MTDLVYVMPADDSSQLGSGTPTDPVRLGGGDFDTFCQFIDGRHQVPGLFLYSGTYHTGGRWAFPKECHFNRPIILRGESFLDTVISLDPSQAIFEARCESRPDTAVLVLGPDANNGPCVVSDFTIQPNESQFSPSQFITAGLWIFANQGEVSNVQVMPLRGSLAQAHETFGILTNNRPNGKWGENKNTERNGGLLIWNCIVYTNAMPDAYDSGIHIGHIEGAVPLTNTVVRECQVIGLGNKAGRVAYAFGARTRFVDCYASNVVYVVYNDTAHASDIMVERMIADRLRYCAVALHRIPEGYPGYKRNITVSDSIFNYTPDNEWVGLTIWDKTADANEGEFERIILRDSVFRGPVDAPQPFCVLAVDARRVANVEQRNCEFPPGAQQHITSRSPSTLQFSRNGIPYPVYKPRPSANMLRSTDNRETMPEPES